MLSLVTSVIDNVPARWHRNLTSRPPSATSPLNPINLPGKAARRTP